MRFAVALLALAVVALAARNGGDAVVQAVRNQVNQWPYSYGGGNNKGATYGVLMKISPYCDDRKVKGFDCSGLSKYGVFQGCGKDIYHGATHQFNQAPQLLPFSEKQPGDLIFYGPSEKDIHHVTIYSGGNMMVEAYGHDHCKGILVRETEIRSKNLIQKVARYCP